MDTYQPIYDAVRSRISGGNVSEAVERAMREGADFSRVIERAQEAVYNISNEMTRPSVLFRPQVGLDGNMYCALYGENLMEGIAGFGETMEAAMRDFDKNWWAMKAPPVKQP